MNTTKKCRNIYVRSNWSGFYVSDGKDIPFTQADYWENYTNHSELSFEELKKVILDCEELKQPYPDYLEYLIPY